MSIRTNRQRDDIAERPTPETPEPLEEEARRERDLSASTASACRSASDRTGRISSGSGTAGR
ncbi:hypothetical protein [Microbispora rosea]